MSFPIVLLVASLSALLVDPTPVNADEAATPSPPSIERVEQLMDTTLTLDGAGAEPRRVLRYTFEPGSRFRRGLDLQVSVTRYLDGGPLPSEKPVPLRVVLEGAVGAAGADGLTPVALTVVTASAVSGRFHAESDVQRLNEAGATLVGRVLTAHVDARGIVRRLDTIEHRGLPEPARTWIPRLGRAVRTLWTPLPEEPVGDDAWWTVDTTRVVLGLALPGSTRTILGGTDDAPTLTLDGKSESGLQPLPGPPEDRRLEGTTEARLIYGVLRLGGELRLRHGDPCIAGGRTELMHQYTYAARRDDRGIDYRDITQLRVITETLEVPAAPTAEASPTRRGTPTSAPPAGD